VKTMEEKGIEQLEEQRVIEAQIRMRRQELQDDAERMKNKQAAPLSDVVASAQVDSCSTDGASTVAASSPRGNDALSSEVQRSELILRNSEVFQQRRGNNFDVDLEEVMLMEAIWLSVQVRQNKTKNRSSIVNLVSFERMLAMSQYCAFSDGCGKS